MGEGLGDWGEREGKGREGGGNERVEVWTVALTEVLGWLIGVARSAAISTSDDATSYVSMAREEIFACV